MSVVVAVKQQVQVNSHVFSDHIIVSMMSEVYHSSDRSWCKSSESLPTPCRETRRGNLPKSVEVRVWGSLMHGPAGAPPNSDDVPDEQDTANHNSLMSAEQAPPAYTNVNYVDYVYPPSLPGLDLPPAHNPSTPPTNQPTNRLRISFRASSSLHRLLNMASRGVSVLKFVGTVSLGLLTVSPFSSLRIPNPGRGLVA